MNRRSICYNAWNIARLAAHLFGGRPIEYISGAMKLAWQGVYQATYLEMVLPAPKVALTGSPKQIAWAEKIVSCIINRGREQAFADAWNGGHMPKLVRMWNNVVVKRVEQITRAGWWIDHRSNPLISIVC